MQLIMSAMNSHHNTMYAHPMLVTQCGNAEVGLTVIAVCPALKIVRDTDPRISVGTWETVGSLGTYPGMGWYVFSKSREFWTATCAAKHLRLCWGN